MLTLIARYEDHGCRRNPRHEERVVVRPAGHHLVPQPQVLRRLHSRF